MSDVQRVRYLSLAWIEALTAGVAANDTIQQLAAEHDVGITQVVTDGPEGDVVYHLQVGDGAAAFGPGEAWPEHIRFEQDWETAVAVATSTLNAQEAFITGRVRVAVTEHQKLIDSQPIFAALDAVFTSVREFTDYD